MKSAKPKPLKSLSGASQNNKMQVRQGTLMLYYCYDVSDEIQLKQVESILGQKPEISKLVSERVPSYVQYRIAPLLVRLGEQELTVGGRKLKAVAEAKLYHFGVITVRFWLPITGPLKAVEKLVTALSAKPEFEKLARRQLKGVLLEIRDAMINAHKPNFWEDYIIVNVARFDHEIGGLELLKKAGSEIAGILCCDTNRLSEQETADALKTPLSYYEDELVLIDWNATFIYNPRVSYDVADVVEFALISSLELRMYDSLLDRALDRAYGDIAVGEKKTFSLSPFGRTIKSLTEIKLEVSEMTDKVEHALKIVGDVYLAKVYTTAARCFWLENWKSSVKDKLTTIESTYKVLHDRTNARMMTILEVMIVALFVLDLILLAAGKI